MRVYQHHSREAEAEWRVQDGKHNNGEEGGGESEDRKRKESEVKEKRQEVPGEALMREIREATETLDHEIRECEVEEERRRQRPARKGSRAA